MAAAKALKNAPVDVTIIDRRNHHLFQPLLYQVATAGNFAPNQIATPIRAIVRHQKNATVELGTVEAIDTAKREVVLGDRRVGYDYLIIATGARHAYFGHDAWEEFAPGLQTLEDATEQRKRILLAFERAELEPDAKEREALTTFVVGGGPTGVGNRLRHRRARQEGACPRLSSHRSEKRSHHPARRAAHPHQLP